MPLPLLAARPVVPCLLALALLAGCGTAPRTPTAKPVAPPAAAPTLPPVPPPIPDGASVTIADLLHLARQQTPTAQAVAAAQAAAQAAVRRSQAWSNPELELRAGSSRPRDGSEADQRTWGGDLRQRVELPGKRSARLAAAQAGEPVAEHEAAQAWLDLEAEVRAAVVGLAAAQLALTQAESAAGLVAEVLRTVESRAQAGDLAQADLARARLEGATAGIAVATRRRELAAALQVLRSWCGDGLPASLTISDALPDTAPAISLEEALRHAQERHPRLRLLQAQLGQRTAEVRQADADRLPDLTLGLSADRAADSTDFGVSFGVDLPLWDRGAGAIDQAEAERSRAAAALRTEGLALARAIAVAWGAYESARLEHTALVAQARPFAGDAVRLHQAAYAAGEGSLADVLESRRAAQAVAEAELAARRATAEAGIALGRAVGSFTSTLAQGVTP